MNAIEVLPTFQFHKGTIKTFRRNAEEVRERISIP